MDLAGLAECSSLDSFVEGLRGSFYYEPLRRLRDQGVTALFDYESALDSLYFIHLWKDMKKQLGRKELEAVSQCIRGKDRPFKSWSGSPEPRHITGFPDHAIEDFLDPGILL
ncbi:MAG: V-type ATPase subunit [Clostridium sp.]